ncbi:MAG: ABC transporter ATP-binding protein [Candidatus Omnitrophica bacterium]|jgi:ABC-type polysaccharide/polyol phosphate transport system ATPase subunit|nr:ABC transporter ATP-binding protein [Candidatus Omnitrophota bacterium]
MRRTKIKSMTTSLTEKKQDGSETAIAVEVTGVSKKFPMLKLLNREAENSREGFWALKDISFEVLRSQIFGVIGRNGAGKTTLLNVIAGILSPTEGKVKTKGRVLSLFNLGVGFQDELSGRENIFLNGAILGATRKELEDKLKAIIDFSEIEEFIHMPLGTYSQGMRLRLAFGIVANLDFDVLLVDEVLAVGDILFQNKCFQRLVDLRREGKTLVITTQGMELIERLCDRAILLDHGCLLYNGSPEETVNQYRRLVATERFSIGPIKPAQKLVTNTKKWADDVSNWGKKLGAKEIVIDSVMLLNRIGFRTNWIKSGDPLRVNVKFTVKDNIKEPHFGVAIFREDGVYCYGPNTEFDNFHIPELKKGKGWFELRLKRVLLAPGIYRISVAIWDQHETLAFDYHSGYYKLEIRGKNQYNNLLDFSFRSTPAACFRHPNVKTLDNKWGKIHENSPIRISEIKLFAASGEEKDVFYTNEPFRLESALLGEVIKKDLYQWIGIYREDGVYCQGMVMPLRKHKNFSICMDELPLLPGKYAVSWGIWDKNQDEFLFFDHGRRSFCVVSEKEDHGTVFLKHKWHWRVSE